MGKALATAGCFVAGCHVDWEQNLLTGPSQEELANSMVPMPVPLGFGSTALARTAQQPLKQGLEEVGEQAARVAEKELSHVFWSGPGAQQAAEGWAKANGGSTLEMSGLGRQAAQATAGLPWEQARPVWEQASRQFAESADGVVHVFQGYKVRLESIWAQIEYQVLRKNPNVKLMYHMVLEDGSVVDIPYREAIVFRIAADNANRIESDEGFSVEILGRGGLCYSEAGNEIRVDSEFLAMGSQFDMVVYGGSVRRWKTPFSEETIDNARRARILDNIRRALESRGLRIDMDT